MLKFPNGFMSHFYVISEQISPLMAWAFFGPNENLRDFCHYFREQLLAFLGDIFSFQKSRFTPSISSVIRRRSYLPMRSDCISHSV